MFFSDYHKSFTDSEQVSLPIFSEWQVCFCVFSPSICVNSLNLRRFGSNSFSFLLAGVALLASPAVRAEDSADACELVRWVLRDERGLKDIPFPDVVLAATGKKVIPVDPKNDAAWLERIGRALDRTLHALNEPEGKIHDTARVNEASRHVEDRLLLELNSEPGWKCTIPKNAGGEDQRSGYPDLRLTMENGKVVYLDPKLYDSPTSTLRTFYYEPKTSTNKIRDDARHLLVAIRHTGKSGNDLRLTSWELVDVSKIRVRLKAEFQASNSDMYRPENIVWRASRAMGNAE